MSRATRRAAVGGSLQIARWLGRAGLREGRAGSNIPTVRTILLTALALIVLLVLFRLALPWIVPRMVYYPEPLGPERRNPLLWGHGEAEEVWLTTSDDVRLHAWWFPARGERRCGVAIFFHGNAGHLAHRGPFAETLANLGFDVLLPDYRGYGASQGRPSEEGLYRDAEAAYAEALSRSGLGPERLLAMGNSLGSSVAAELARRHPVGALALVSPFTSTVAVGRRAYRFLPEGYLDWVDHRYDAGERLEDMTVPLLVIRGGRDRIIPEAESRAVFEAAAGPKGWYEQPEAGHNDLLGFEGPWRALRDFAGEHVCP